MLPDTLTVNGCAVPLQPAPRRVAAKVRNPRWRWMRRFWRGVREWCGDAAYERYLRSRNKPGLCHNGHNALSAQEFYVDQLNRRYSRPNRCC